MTAIGQVYDPAESCDTSVPFGELVCELDSLEEALNWSVTNRYFAKIMWVCNRATALLERPGTPEEHWSNWDLALKRATDKASDAELQMLLRFQQSDFAAAWSEARDSSLVK